MVSQVTSDEFIQIYSSLDIQDIYRYIQITSFMNSIITYSLLKLSFPLGMENEIEQNAILQLLQVSYNLTVVDRRNVDMNKQHRLGH